MPANNVFNPRRRYWFQKKSDDKQWFSIMNSQIKKEREKLFQSPEKSSRAFIILLSSNSAARLLLLPSHQTGILQVQCDPDSVSIAAERHKWPLDWFFNNFTPPEFVFCVMYRRLAERSSASGDDTQQQSVGHMPSFLDINRLFNQKLKVVCSLLYSALALKWAGGWWGWSKLCSCWSDLQVLNDVLQHQEEKTAQMCALSRRSPKVFSFINLHSNAASLAELWQKNPSSDDSRTTGVINSKIQKMTENREQIHHNYGMGGRWCQSRWSWAFSEITDIISSLLNKAVFFVCLLKAALMFQNDDLLFRSYVISPLRPPLKLPLFIFSVFWFMLTFCWFSVKSVADVSS